MERTKNFTRNYDAVDTTPKHLMWKKKLPVCRRRASRRGA